MKEYALKQKTYIKSNNSIKKISKEYTVSLILFSILTIIINIIINNKELSISLTKSLLLSFIITSILTYLINITKKEYKFLKIYTEDNIEQLAIILGLFGVNINIYVLTISILVSLIVKNISKKINISSSLYGILIIILYKYLNNDLVITSTTIKNLLYNTTLYEILTIDGGIINYLFGIKYLSPILSILAFFYLFHNKSIKYNLVFSYTLTFFTIMFLIGIFNNSNLWFGIFELFTGSTPFLITYTLTDYRITPTISEANIIYGIILGIVSSILRFIIPELSIIITLIIGPIILTNQIDKLSIKLKYNHKLYNSIIFSLIFIVVITIISISVII